MCFKDLRSPSMEYALELSKQILKSTSCTPNKATLRKSQTLDAEWSTPIESQEEILVEKAELKIPDFDRRRHSLTTPSEVTEVAKIQGQLRRSKSTCDQLVEDHKGTRISGKKDTYQIMLNRFSDSIIFDDQNFDVPRFFMN